MVLFFIVWLNKMTGHRAPLTQKIYSLDKLNSIPPVCGNSLHRKNLLQITKGISLIQCQGKLLLFIIHNSLLSFFSLSKPFNVLSNDMTSNTSHNISDSGFRFLVFAALVEQQIWFCDNKYVLHNTVLVQLLEHEHLMFISHNQTELTDCFRHVVWFKSKKALID